jgi:flavin-dependent dehydrogenase
MEFGKIVAWTVMQDEFDCWILSGAMKAGTCLVDGQEATEVETIPNRAYVRTAEEVYSCLAVVGADGANGVVGRSAG